MAQGAGRRRTVGRCDRTGRAACRWSSWRRRRWMRGGVGEGVRRSDGGRGWGGGREEGNGRAPPRPSAIGGERRTRRERGRAEGRGRWKQRERSAGAAGEAIGGGRVGWRRRGEKARARASAVWKRSLRGEWTSGSGRRASERQARTRGRRLRRRWRRREEWVRSSAARRGTHDSVQEGRQDAAEGRPAERRSRGVAGEGTTPCPTVGGSDAFEEVGGVQRQTC